MRQGEKSPAEGLQSGWSRQECPGGMASGNPEPSHLCQFELWNSFHFLTSTPQHPPLPWGHWAPSTFCRMRLARKAASAVLQREVAF